MRHRESAYGKCEWLEIAHPWPACTDKRYPSVRPPTCCRVDSDGIVGDGYCASSATGLLGAAGSTGFLSSPIPAPGERWELAPRCRPACNGLPRAHGSRYLCVLVGRCGRPFLRAPSVFARADARTETPVRVCRRMKVAASVEVPHDESAAAGTRT
nr:unnamed protein product [Digitaria exilis]